MSRPDLQPKLKRFSNMENKRYPNSTVDLLNCIQEATEYIRDKLGQPEMAIVLGTGLGKFHEKLEDKK